MLPKKIDAFGKKVKIIETNKHIDEFNPVEAYGVFCRERWTIYIRENLNDKEKIQTLIHEYLHAVFHRLHLNCSLDEHSENIMVDTIATAITENFNIEIK